MGRIQNGANGINNILRILVDNMSEVTINIVGMLTIIAFFDQMIAAVMVFYFVTFLAIAYFMFGKATLASYLVKTEYENLQGLQFESINNIRTIKVLQMSESISKSVGSTAQKVLKKIHKRVFWYRSTEAMLTGYGKVFRLLIVALVVLGISKGRYEVGFITLAYTYFNKIWENAMELSKVAQDFAEAKYSVFRMQEILDEPIGIESDKGKKVLHKNWQQIKVKNLSFQYGDNQVLHQLNFNIHRGERVGLVGVSGAGKSTIFKLLSKQYEDYEGTIKIDDASLREIKNQSYLSRVAMVMQETELFNLSLRGNIEAASEQPFNQKRFDEALNIAHVTDFIHKLPQGVETLVGEKGVKLSGGEKQRIGIARAIYRNPEILFLDEATSHLDIESERKIQDSLHQFFKNITAVVIAHRLSTIKEMDRILVMQDGKIIEQGSFEGLMKKKGRFYQLWQKQEFR
ncbi:ABC transporter ATP-binding protein [Candidatus Peregrinibacteria bacterium]|nr:MAG: ABC transporter ATP-binding protein [Candidatus Peregrinibacteria bacterium]